jgi:AcrR family transcriptional regulator
LLKVARNPDLATTREELLQAGLQILFSKPTVLGLRNVPVTEVAEVAGRTTGAVYQIWPKQPDFHLDLAIAAIKHDTVALPPQALAAYGAPVMERGGTFEEFVGAAADGYLHDLATSRAFVVVISFWAAALDTPELGDAVRENYADLTATWAEAYEMILAHYGRRMRAPYTAADLAVGIRSVAEGFALRRRFDEASVESPRADGLMPVFTATILGLADRITEPIDSISPHAPDNS